jgi:RNA polymerase sigma factor (sigma-70 family)
VENHRRFLSFLERRVNSRDVAEDILQDVFVRGIGRIESLRDRESVVAWFYRMLRNAITDHYRRRGAEERALSGFAREPREEVGPAPDKALMEAVCECVRSLVEKLKPQYGEAIRRVDLEGMSVQGFAIEAGITASNAGVRLHRAREALRRQLLLTCGTCVTHGCLNCTCELARNETDQGVDCGP